MPSLRSNPVLHARRRVSSRPAGASLGHVTIYLIALTAALLGSVAPSFAAPDSLFRMLRVIPMLAVYALFVVMAASQGVRVAGLWWIGLTGVSALLVLVAEATYPPADRKPLLGVLWTFLLWPLAIPSATERLMTWLGIIPEPPEMRLPDPPRGPELAALPDDEMLVAAHQILSGQADLTAEEQSVLVAETFNREVHGGGFGQWFSNTQSSVSDTVQALRAVGAHATANLLQRAADAVPATWSETQPLEARLRALGPIDSVLRSLTDSFFSLERQEDLTSLVAAFVRQHRSRFPALAT
jgi:Domain of unknown function (DUF4375)